MSKVYSSEEDFDANIGGLLQINYTYDEKDIFQQLT